MKKLLFLVFVIISHWSYGQVWSEDFAAEANGATSGTATGTPGGTWSVTTTPASTFAVQNVPIVGKSFFVNNNLTEGRWESNAFTIPAPGFATISVELVTALTLFN